MVPSAQAKQFSHEVLVVQAEQKRALKYPNLNIPHQLKGLQAGSAATLLVAVIAVQLF